MRGLGKYLLVVALVSTLFSQDEYVMNFNKPLHVDGNELKIVSGVIVKSALSKVALKNRLHVEVKELAFLENSNLYLVDSNNSLAYSQELALKDYIIYAQPNMLQKVTSNKKESYDITDINLTNIYGNAKGSGVKIAIIDDGFNLKHEDLKGLHVSFEYDATSKNMSINPKYNIDFHGTLVAGVIFARRNSFGVDGIAPQAKLIAIRQTTNLTSDVILAFTVASLASADIINCSWNSPMLLEPIYDTVVNIAKNGRDGKGVAVVFSAGNSSSFLEVNSTESAIEEVITVGASQKYSNYGDVVDIILKSGIKSTYKNGYENFSGTSATASMVSGLLALELEQNRSLHVNDLLENLKKRLNKIKD